MNVQTTKRISGLVAAVLVVAAAQPARAEQKKSPLEGQPAIRHKLEMRKGRIEVTPQFVVSINQDFRHFIGGGLQLQYHALDWLGFGVQVAGGGGLDTGLTTKIADEIAAQKTPARYQPTVGEFRAHLASTQLLLSAFATITPFAGKLAMFGAGFLRYDLYAIVGIGVQRLTNGWDGYTGQKTEQTACNNADQDPTVNINQCNPVNDGFRLSGTFGAGLHLYFNQWLGLNVELRDYLNSQNPGGLDQNFDHKISSEDQRIANNLFVGVGLTLMFPITAKVSP